MKKLLEWLTIDTADVRDPASGEHFPGGAHVQHLYSDGELTSTKGGELYGQRTLHCFFPGFGAVNDVLHARLMELGGELVTIRGVEYARLQVRDDADTLIGVLREASLEQ